MSGPQLDIDSIEARADLATPGPWAARDEDGEFSVYQINDLPRGITTYIAEEVRQGRSVPPCRPRSVGRVGAVTASSMMLFRRLGSQEPMSDAKPLKCPECGRTFESMPCGFTHAAMASNIGFVRRFAAVFGIDPRKSRGFQ